MDGLIAIATVAVAIVLIAWFFIGKNPAQSDRDEPESRESDSDRFYSRNDRPAGPDAEVMDPDVMLGNRTPDSASPRTESGSRLPPFR